MYGETGGGGVLLYDRFIWLLFIEIVLRLQAVALQMYIIFGFAGGGHIFL